MPFTYILRCADGTLYVGSTRFDVQQRVHQHSIGEGSRNTACPLPVELLWCAELEKVTDAFGLEKQLQGWSLAKRLARVEGRFEDLPALARSRSTRRGLDELRPPGRPPEWPQPRRVSPDGVATALTRRSWGADGTWSSTSSSYSSTHTKVPTGTRESARS